MNQKQINYHSKVIEWAKERGLLSKDSIVPQFKKLFEELAELISAIMKNKRDEEIDAFGDYQVVVTIFCEQLEIYYPKNNYAFNANYDLELLAIESLGNLSRGVRLNDTDRIAYFLNELNSIITNHALNRGVDMEEALELAYNEIKNRKGKKVNGSFVKDE